MVRIQTAVPLNPGARIRVERRLLAFTRDLANEVLSPMRAEEAEQLTAPGRGVIYQLEQNLGTVTRRDAADQLELLTRGDRSVLARLGVAMGRRLVFVRELVTPGAIQKRRLLCALIHADVAALPGLELAPPILDLSAPLEPRAEGDPTQEDDHEEPIDQRRIEDLDLDDHDYVTLGYLRVAHFALRGDVVEELAQRFAPRARGRRPESIPNLARWLGLRSADIRLLLSSLRIRPRRRRRPRRPPGPRT
jgi:ATP-dependent RNA helicase SUPV3L1/SUV3